MTVVLNEVEDLNLKTLERVALRREKVRFGREATRRIRESYADFQALVRDRPSTFVYGVTSDYGPNAKKRLDTATRNQLKKMGVPFVGLSLSDDYLPETTVRAMVFAMLALFLRGGAAVSVKTANSLTQALDGPMPRIPAAGLTSPGEIMPMFYLYEAFPELFRDAVQGSPGNSACCSTGFASLLAMQATRRLAVAEKIFSLSYEAMQAPLEHIDPALGPLWGDPYESTALDHLNHWLASGDRDNRRPFQAPVSYRILPRVLGQAHRALHRLGTCAEESLRAMASNPMFFPPAGDGYGQAISTGGFHNARIPQALDGMSMSWVDLAELARRHIIKLHKGPVSRLPDRLVREGDHYRSGRSTTYIEFASADVIDEMRRFAEPALLSPAEPGASEQDDVSAPGLIACRNHARVAQGFDRVMAILAGVASHALDVCHTSPPPNLRAFTGRIRKDFPPVTEKHALGEDATRLARSLSAAIETAESPLADLS